MSHSREMACPEESDSCHILVVDDAPDVRLILKKSLAKRGFEVSEALSGPEAIEMATVVGGYDCILLDVVMPGMDGFEVCEKLKQDERTADVPVIFLTGADDPDNVVKGLAVGANDYVSKPIVLRTLLARVEVALRLRRAEQRERRARQASEDAYRQLAAAKSDLQVAHRMTGLTVLAAGLAHELNSPLGALSTNLSFLAEEIGHMRAGETADDVTLEDCLDAAKESLDSCERVSAVVNRMRLYGERARARTAAPVDLGALLQDLCEQAATNHDAAWEIDTPDDFSVYGVEIELHEALRAVVNNAFVAAVSGDGDAKVQLRVSDLGDQALLVVEDSGEGIPEEDLPFVFDPFFTRKAAWRSVGLGLGIALSILERHSGEIAIDGTSPLGGAAVRIRLPTRPPAIAPEPAALPTIPTLG